jgi:hypothetical protein
MLPLNAGLVADGEFDACGKLMLGALIRAAERWRSVKVTEFERRQRAAVRKKLDQEYEARNQPPRPISKGAPERIVKKGAGVLAEGLRPSAAPAPGPC